MNEGRIVQKGSEQIFAKNRPTRSFWNSSTPNAVLQVYESNQERKAIRSIIPGFLGSIFPSDLVLHPCFLINSSSAAEIVIGSKKLPSLMCWGKSPNAL